MGYPLQYSCLENSVDRGAWWATVPRSQKLDRTEATNIQHTQSMNNVAKPLRFDLTFDALILVENTDKEVLLQDLGCCIQIRVCVCGGGCCYFGFLFVFAKRYSSFLVPFVVPYQAACGILVLQTGIEPMLPALEVLIHSLNQWTTWQVHMCGFFVSFVFLPPEPLKAPGSWQCQ